VSFIAVFFSLIIHHTNAAEQSGLCENLSRFSCAPGTQNDGTGDSTTKDPLDTSATALLDSKKDVILSRFHDLLNDPDNAYIKKLSYSAAGLADAPQCNSTEPQQIRKCESDLDTALLSMTKRQLLGVNVASAGHYQLPGAKISDKQLFFENAIIKKTFDDFEKDFGITLERPKVEAKIRDKIFPEVKKLLAKKINSLSISEEQKKFMMEKVKSIYYAGTDCEEMAGGLAKSMLPNAFYDPLKNHFKVCKGLLNQSDSDFHLVGVIAHELAHSIDPCGITIGPEKDALVYKNDTELDKMDKEYPISGLIACLRSEKSIAAKNFDASGMNSAGNPATYGIYQQNSSGKKVYTYCNNRDQVGEAVSDWFSAEVTVDYIEANHPNLTKEQWQIGFSNIYRPICFDTNTIQMWMADVHADTPRRIDSVILTNKSVREKMGCTKPHSKYSYCDPHKPSEMQRIAQEGKPVNYGMPGSAPGPTMTPIPGPKQESTEGVR
jgi:hypothetical protein